MNKRVQFIRKPSRVRKTGATPFPLRRRGGDVGEVNMDDLQAQHRRSFHALRLLSGVDDIDWTTWNGDLDGPIRIQRSQPPKNSATLQP